MSGAVSSPRAPTGSWQAVASRHLGTLLAYGLLLAMILAYGTLEPAAFRTFQLTSTLNNSMTLVIAAVGQTLVVLTGGIDLSVGALISVANTLAATAMAAGFGRAHPLLVALGILAQGAAAGWLNGALVAWGRLQPILVTLATMSVWEGVALLILPSPGGSVPTGFSALLTGDLWQRVPDAALVLAAVAGSWYVVRHSRLGTWLLAIGSDRPAARASGIPVQRALIAAYTLSGLYAAAAGLFLSAQTASGDPTSGASYTLTSIAAVVVGGTSLMGGRGSAAGSIAGALVLSLLVSLLYFTGVSSFYQDLLQGAILLVAVALSSVASLAASRGSPLR